jgi:hypothetical protein
MSDYRRFWNSRERTHPLHWFPPIGAPCPGNIYDTKPYGFRRFERYYRLPVRAWKLYWRRRP